MADIEQVAVEFVEFYYNAFDTNREDLAGIYVSRPLVPLFLGIFLFGIDFWLIFHHSVFLARQFHVDF